MTNYRICLYCHHLFKGTKKDTPCCSECQAGGPGDHGWSVHLDNAKDEDLVALIPAIVRKFESVNERLARLEALVVS